MLGLGLRKAMMKSCRDAIKFFGSSNLASSTKKENLTNSGLCHSG